MAAQETYKKRAVIKDGTQKVLSVINVAADYKIPGYHLVQMESNICHKACFTTPDNDVSCDGAAFTLINGLAAGQIDSSGQPEAGLKPYHKPAAAGLFMSEGR